MTAIARRLQRLEKRFGTAVESRTQNDCGLVSTQQVCGTQGRRFPRNASSS